MFPLAAVAGLTCNSRMDYEETQRAVDAALAAGDLVAALRLLDQLMRDMGAEPWPDD